METENKPMSSEQSLALIASMIESTRNELRENGSWFLLWGWLVFIAAAGHFILMKAGFEKPYLAWMLMPLGGVISAVKGIREEKQQKVKTQLDSLMNAVLIAFLVCLLMVLVFMPKLGLATYPMVMMVYGIWLFISGSAIRFRPLQAGGVLNWVLAIAAFYFTFDMQLLLLALAVLGGYIIPGYMLRFRYNKQQITQAR
jgi:hypothetical protein